MALKSQQNSDNSLMLICSVTCMHMYNVPYDSSTVLHVL